MARERADTTATTGLGLSRGTLLRAALAGGVLLAAVGGIAWLGGERKAAGPLETYRRLGSTAGAAALERDLRAQFPTGTPAAPLIRHLESQGFACSPQGAAWRCTHAAPGAETGRIWRAEVTIAVERETVSGVTARFSDAIR
ncbi:hypothetical protein [Paracraurococcus lichenis]|uniref:DUF4333 domain-containing protein n=1 Tax=Paracraurococcus lichenis TaxID=3064888 RepID=A0ABT9E598_9PROT|nr:hypothetical protein [Paracraurococcus sp. LOR1-02]MDO9711333.1 hypothetical protein [Paracraurococcus sp. LOR1-02]